MGALNEQEASRLLAGIVIPPRPTVLTAVMEESARELPDSKRITGLIAADVALAAAVLKTVNAPLYGLRRQVTDIGQAVSLLGMGNISTLITALALRTAVAAQGLDRFWDSAARAALVCAYMAKQLGCAAPSDAHLFGLFRDCGIPLMMQRFSDYKDTLRLANAEAERPFTTVEDARHQTNHAIVGSLLAANWNLSEALRVAISAHHDLAVYQSGISPQAMNLVAIGLLSEYIENGYSRLTPNREWDKLGAQTLGHLMLGQLEMEELCRDAHALLEESGL